MYTGVLPCLLAYLRSVSAAARAAEAHPPEANPNPNPTPNPDSNPKPNPKLDPNQEAVLNLYIGKLKPLLTQDKWMPAAVRRAIHEAADELWADVML